MTQTTPQIHWRTDTPRPGFHTVTALDDDTRGFLHWMATDGPTPVMGTWDGTSLIIPAAEEDYLWTVLGANFADRLVRDGEWDAATKSGTGFDAADCEGGSK